MDAVARRVLGGPLGQIAVGPEIHRGPFRPSLFLRLPRVIASNPCMRLGSTSSVNGKDSSSSSSPPPPSSSLVDEASRTLAEEASNNATPRRIPDPTPPVIKKISKRLDSTAHKENFEESPVTEVLAPSQRKIKKSEKRRREELNNRPQKSQAQKSLRRVGSDTALPRAETRPLRAYCVSEAFSFPKLRALLGQHGHYPFTALSDDCIHVTALLDSHNSSPTGDIFFFMDGTVVTWGLTEDENLRLLSQIKPAEMEPYRDIEEEELDYIQDPQLITGMMGETVIIGKEQDAGESSIYSKLAFSNGIARSTKLAVLEEQLDNYLDSTRDIPRILARGNKLPWGRQKTLQKVGELLAFRGELNLHSELVETPDLYWAKPQLEEYYNRISKTLDVAVRITILNKKLDYANELAATLRSHLSEKHGLALEWGIIGLIAIEVVFGIIQLAT